MSQIMYPKATIIRRDEETGVSVCKCHVCGREFLAGGNRPWHNHFYCSEQCALARWGCPQCGKNRNFCGCDREV